MICRDCQVEMRCKENGVKVRWKKRRVRRGDAWECPRCGVEVIVFNPDSEYYRDTSDIGDFLELKDR